MERWQEAASRQATMLSDNLTQLLSRGLGWLRSELGVDVGLEPELIPPWVILSAACAGLLLMAALWASVCRTLTRKRTPVGPVDSAEELTGGTNRPVKTEEPKKRKKRSEKKVQPNGKAVSELQEEAIVAEAIVAHQQLTESKADKAAEVKKSKKKGKQPVKQTKTVTTNGKEPEEGTWETKVSNKEKREQRKKDKGSSDGSGSPGGGNTPVNVPSEQPNPPAAPAPAPAAPKKKKGDSNKMKAEKVEAVACQANSELADVAAPVTDIAVKASAQISGPKTGTWTAREQPSMWASGIDESWTVIERGMPGTELNMVSLSGLTMSAAEPQPVSDLPWLSQPRVDDEWSGLNGSSADPGSDWNAPSEAWGNYEEPSTKAPPSKERPPMQPSKVELLTGADDEDDEKDKGEASADGAAKTKKKKKKKKKTGEEGASGQVEEPEKEIAPAALGKKSPPVAGNTAPVQPINPAAGEVRAERPVKNNKSQKPPVTQVPQKPTNDESTAKQTVSAAPTQQKPEDIQAPKPAKKKKARRET